MEEKAADVSCQVDRLDFACSVIKWHPPASREGGIRAFFLQRPVWKVRGDVGDPSFCRLGSRAVLVHPCAAPGHRSGQHKQPGGTWIFFRTSRIAGVTFNDRTVGFTALM